MKSSKKSQAQVIVTVLLILIVLAAVALVSTFVIRLVRDNLQGTDCFKTIGAVSVNKEYTDFDSDTTILNLSISRTVEEFNLTGLSVSISAGASATKYELLSGDNIAGELAMYGDSLSNPTKPITLPKAQETLTYQINTTLSNVDGIKIAPIINKGKQCDIVDVVSI